MKLLFFIIFLQSGYNKAIAFKEGGNASMYIFFGIAILFLGGGYLAYKNHLTNLKDKKTVKKEIITKGKLDNIGSYPLIGKICTTLSVAAWHTIAVNSMSFSQCRLVKIISGKAFEFSL